VSSGDPAELDLCYVTTSGRMTGRAHRIEIWFALQGGKVYLLSGGGDRSDWVRNLMVSSDVVLEIGDTKRTTSARIVQHPDEDALARRLLLEKYRPRYGGDLDQWGKTALPVVLDWRTNDGMSY
jgi:deazaflavin-dependent oxidoreductase (nitroreductase family)